MAFRRRFAFRLAVRLLLLFAMAVSAAKAAALGDAPMTAFLATIAAGLVGVSLWRIMNEANLELTRFVTALEQFDFGQMLLSSTNISG